MELAQLRVFMQVAAHLHVSKAARELHMAQPAVSRQIRELERACGGIALIQKVGRNVQLTEAGEVLFAHAQRIKGMKGVGPQLHARTNLANLCGLLQHFDLKALLGQCQSGCQAADAATGHQHWKR